MPEIHPTDRFQPKAKFRQSGKETSLPAGLAAFGLGLVG
jgi:hypothetical protein